MIYYIKATFLLNSAYSLRWSVIEYMRLDSLRSLNLPKLKITDILKSEIFSRLFVALTQSKVRKPSLCRRVICLRKWKSSSCHSGCPRGICWQCGRLVRSLGQWRLEPRFCKTELGKFSKRREFRWQLSQHCVLRPYDHSLFLPSCELWQLERNLWLYSDKIYNLRAIKRVRLF